MGSHEVHVTELSEFRTCRLSWSWAYQEGLIPKVERVGTALWFGTAVHHSLAKFYGEGVSPLEALLTWPGYQGSSVPLLEGVLEHYEQTYRGDLDRWEVLSIETPYRVRVPHTRSYLIGTFDLRVRDRVTGHVLIVDHKTRSYFDGSEDLELNEQATAYSWLARQIGQPARGVLWNEIRKATPALNPRTTEFFRRTELVRSNVELDQFEEDLRRTVREMSSKHLVIYPNPGIHCSIWHCPFRIPCRARRQGSDVEAVKEALFTTEVT